MFKEIRTIIMDLIQGVSRLLKPKKAPTDLNVTITINTGDSSAVSVAIKK